MGIPKRLTKNGTAIAKEALFIETGFPEDLFRTLKIGSRDVGKVIEDPVAAIISAEDETDAIRIANDTQFGLGAAVFTGDIRETFFFNQISARHHVNHAQKGDFLIDNGYIFETGGRNKTRKQIKGLDNFFL